MENNLHGPMVDALKYATKMAVGGLSVVTDLTTEKPLSSAKCLAINMALQDQELILAEEQDIYSWMI